MWNLKYPRSVGITSWTNPTVGSTFSRRNPRGGSDGRSRRVRPEEDDDHRLVGDPRQGLAHADPGHYRGRLGHGCCRLFHLLGPANPSEEHQEDDREELEAADAVRLQ